MRNARRRSVLSAMDNTHRMTGAQLRRLRTRLHVTQAELAHRLGVHWNTLARWERDELPIRPPMARLLDLLVKGSPPPHGP